LPQGNCDHFGIYSQSRNAQEHNLTKPAQIAVEAPWGEIGTVARRLIDREFTGKAVLHIA
jgi:hypothetical protein